jgi:hypothetical protein
MDHIQVDPSWRVDVKAARVDLYCGHDARALQHLIHAREALLRQPGPWLPELLPHLASAQWLMRHHRYGEAHAELQAALDG